MSLLCPVTVSMGQQSLKMVWTSAAGLTNTPHRDKSLVLRVNKPPPPVWLHVHSTGLTNMPHRDESLALRVNKPPPPAWLHVHPAGLTNTPHRDESLVLRVSKPPATAWLHIHPNGCSPCSWSPHHRRGSRSSRAPTQRWSLPCTHARQQVATPPSLDTQGEGVWGVCRGLGGGGTARSILYTSIMATQYWKDQTATTHKNMIFIFNYEIIRFIQYNFQKTN